MGHASYDHHLPLRVVSASFNQRVHSHVLFYGIAEDSPPLYGVLPSTGEFSGRLPRQHSFSLKFHHLHRHLGQEMLDLQAYLARSSRRLEKVFGVHCKPEYCSTQLQVSGIWLVAVEPASQPCEIELDLGSSKPCSAQLPNTAQQSMENNHAISRPNSLGTPPV